MAKVAPSEEEAVKELLEYLVDPLLPLKISSKNRPSLSNQQSVAKQMHAAVILYNYYQRKQHPKLRFLEYQPFCQLALNLKPTLRAHMNLEHPSETISSDLRNQLSITEKAVMDACDISLSLDALGDIPNAEVWPVAKISVFLIDTKKENCVLRFGSITNGVWSVIEECVDVSEGYSEIPSEGTASETMRVGKRTPTDQKDAKGLGFEHLAFAAVKKATGIHQSELVVLERHAVYSLSKEKTAAYFYIMQCMQPSKIFDVPIKDVIEGLRGPLLKWVSGSWTPTQVVEYYDVLPYAMILSSWYSREVMSNGSEDIRSFETGTKNCCEKIAGIEQDNYLQSLSEGLGNIEVNSSVILGDGSNGEFREVLDIYDWSSTDVKSRGDEAIADYISKTVEKEGEEMQKPSESVAEESSLAVEKEGQEILISDHCSEVTHPTLGKFESAAHCSGRKTIGSKNSNLRELESEEKENSGKPWEIIELNVERFENGFVAPCTVKGTIDLEKCKMMEGEIEDIEKSYKSFGTTHPTTGQLETGAYFEEQLENCIDAPCTRKEAIESGKFKREEVEFGNTKMSGESLDTTHPNAWQLETGAYCEETIGSLKCNREEKNVETENYNKLFDGVHSAIKNLENDTFLSIDEGTMGTENSKRVEKEVKIRKTLDLCSKIIDPSVKEFTNSINENFSCKETIGDDAERTENRVECREKSDKCCDAVNSTIKKLSSSDLENSEQYPPNDLQTIEYAPKKRQKMDFNEVMMNLLKNKCQNKNTEVPIRVYQRLKRKIPLKSGLSTSVTSASINVEAADNPKSLSGESIEENVTENSINGSIQSNLLGPAVEECAVVSVLAKRDAALTQTALSVLFSKRAKLCHQQHILQDEVAVCDANIEKIIEGKEDALALKLDAIIDGCTNMIQREGPTGALSMQ